VTTAIHLAGAADLEPLLALMERFHAERALAHDDAHRRRAAGPLLEGSPHGAIWLIGPQRAPLGYVTLSFGWSVALAGREAFVQEVFIRPSVRGRGIGTEVLHSIAVSLTAGGIKALHVRLDRDDAGAARFCARVGFAARPDMVLMTDVL
jgi:GNAT superfamily N-acetyltransferase